MELLLDPITVNCRKVLAGFKLIGADYTIKKVDYFYSKTSSELIIFYPQIQHQSYINMEFRKSGEI